MIKILLHSVFKYNYILKLSIAFILISAFSITKLSAQFAGTGIYTDYNGFWASSSTAKSPIKPDNKHNLLAFTWNGVTYSTGVDNAKLTSQGIAFTPAKFQAFPVKDIPLPGTASNFIGLGQLEDGVDNGGLYPYSVPVTVSQILTRGIQGLDMGSCITNIPATAQPLSFNFGAITTPNQIGDGIPDILITQVAQATGSLDSVYFENGSGQLIGNKIAINQSLNPELGEWLPDFYLPSTGVIQPGFIKTARPIRIWAADASAFGINAQNYTEPLILRYKLGGSSDPAFLAFNTSFITLVTANDDLAGATLNTPVNIPLLVNDIPSNPANLSSYTVPTTSAHGTIVKNANGTVTYTPNTGYYGQDTFTYTICTTINGTTTCDDGVVTVNISPDVNAPTFTSGTNLQCQAGPPSTYGAQATFATQVRFAISPNTAGTISNSATTINSSTNVASATGTVTWSSTFFGPATITAIASGSNGPKSTTYSVNIVQAPTLELTSGSANQTICSGSAIGDIVYTYGGGSTGVTVTGIASGNYTINTTAKTVTISGLIASTSNYTITTIGHTSPCGPVALTGTITVNPISTLSAGGGPVSQIVCNGSAISPITYTFGGSATTAIVTNLPAGLTSNINGKVLTISGIPTASGTYTVTTSGHTAPCAAIVLTGTITTQPLPTAGSIAASQTICNGATPSAFTSVAGTSSTGGTITYRWELSTDNLNWTTIASQTGPTYAPGALTATSYFRRITIATQNGIACQSVPSNTITITVNALPTASIAGTTTVCRNATAPNVTFTGANGTAPYTFTYKINGGSDQTVVSVGNVASVSQLTSTASTFTYTLVSVRDASSTACLNSATGSAIITINPLPTANISAGTAVCQNAATPTVTFTGASGTAPYTFTYNINGGSSTTITTTSGNSVSINAPTGSVGTFNYNLTSVKDASSTTCTGTATGTASIVVNPLPTATIGGTTAVCLNATSPAIIFTGAVGTAPYTFTYNINGGSNQTVTTSTGNSVAVNVQTTAAGTFTYNLVSVRDASSTTCSNTTSGAATVTVNPLPTASISGTTAVCRNATSPTITFTGANGTAPYTFTYKINGGSDLTTVSNGSTATVSQATTGAGSFIYTLVSVKDASGTTCTNTASGTATITVNQLPTASISGNATVCRNGTAPTVSFTAASGTAPYTFTYTLNGGANQTITSTGNTATITQATGTVGSFAYTLVSVQDASSTACTNTATGTATVVVKQLPSAAISGATAVCVNANQPNVTFTGSAGTAPYTFTYTINGGSPLSVTTTSGNTVTVAAPTTTAGSFVYALVSVSDAGTVSCSNTASGSATITVNPLPTASISGTTDVCLNATASNITFTGANGTAPYTFTYKINGGSDLTTTSTANTATVSRSTATAGTFTYTLVSVRDASGTSCLNTASGTAVVKVNPLPTASISGTTAVCRNATAPAVTFTGANGTAPYNFTYKINGGSDLTIVSSGNTATVSQATGTVGPFVYTLVSVRDASTTTCTNAANGTATITVNPLPTASISGTTAVCRNATSPTITFTGANGTAPYTFTYDIDGGTPLTVTTTSGSSVTVAAPTTTVGSFIYNLLSVRDASNTTCLNTASGSATITINAIPQGANATATVDCTGAFSHTLQNDITNGINSTFTWTVATSGNVVGAAAGSGNTITQTLYNTSTIAQTVTYTVTPKATGAGTCDGNTFTVTVTVPVCSSLSITKTSSTTAVNAVGNVIPYTITAVNTGNANQTNVVLTDALLGGVIGSPVKTGGDTDVILEKGETWTYSGSYTVTQGDLNNNGNPTNNSGKITNSASVVTDQIPAGQTTTKDVA
ncbi:MAG: hypothetical protein EOP00_05365, partial [Pedobacter sp.]